MRLLNATTGEDYGAWDIGLGYGHGKPFGVRTITQTMNGPTDLLAIAVMDNPQDGINQKILIVDTSDLKVESGITS